MVKDVQAVIIGGGVVGCSVLYHLTKLGWKDIMLLERSSLTSGSTWHAAGGFHTLNADTNIASLQGYTIGLYDELEEISGQSCGLHHVGGLTLACRLKHAGGFSVGDSEDRMDFLKDEEAKVRYMGLETHLVTPKEIEDLSPITNIDGIIGALYDPLDGHLDPSGTTHAYAKAAQIQGAEISINNRVLATNPKADGSWEVITEKGKITAEHVVNAAGLWAREVGAMAGVYLPLHPMEHQYIVSDRIEEIASSPKELCHVIDPSAESYLRQEGQGIVIGFYEQDCTLWAVDGSPWNFGHELLPDDLDRIDHSMQQAFHRFPILKSAGIKSIINGPFTFTPDGNPLVGPVPGLANYWSACAVMAGFSQGGGVGLSLAEWMVNGEPSRDIFAMDVARFGTYCTEPYTRQKVREYYQRRFSVPYPNEELPVARPFRTTPAYSIWQSKNAVFGSVYGMEVVNYFAKQGDSPYEIPCFRRSNAFDVVGEECRAVRNAVGINEIHNFSKFEITGENCEAWISKIMAGRIPDIGKISLSPMLSPQGRLIGDFTVSRLKDSRFQLHASYVAQSFHMRWFETNLPDQGVQIRNISDDLIGFHIAGPQSRKLLSQVCNEDVSNESFPFMSVRSLQVGPFTAIVFRVSYTGDLGYEIYVPRDHQVGLFRLLEAAGQPLGLRPFGMRAMMSLRLEKSFGSWLREYRPDYSPMETGLNRFIDYKRDIDFIGKQAALHERDNPPDRKLCTLIVDTEDTDAVGDEPIFFHDDVVGFVTSGGYAHFCQKSVAIGFLPTGLIDSENHFAIELLGKKCPAVIQTPALFDPVGSRMRG
ncbi:MAG: FAD-dependent oxidoreductase [Gammaproteobacteria bacterium]|nr:FAD-dependent oxidoreductase [Gammaproteobacteria bacterium]